MPTWAQPGWAGPGRTRGPGLRQERVESAAFSCQRSAKVIRTIFLDQKLPKQPRLVPFSLQLLGHWRVLKPPVHVNVAIFQAPDRNSGADGRDNIETANGNMKS